MDKLIKLIQKHFVTIVFVLLFVFCCVLLFSKKKYHRAFFYNLSNSVFCNISESWDKFIHIKKLQSINDSLANENAELKNILEKYRTTYIPPIKTYRFSYISAQIFDINISEKNNLLRINKGTKNHIEEGMGVISSNGVVGFVLNCQAYYANIVPVINKNFNLSVKLLKNNYYGSLSWDGKNVCEATVSDIPEYVHVEIGDTVVTSNLSTLFPENIPVGVVIKIDTLTSTAFSTLTVKLCTDFNNLSYVYVIKNSYKPDTVLTPDE